MKKRIKLASKRRVIVFMEYDIEYSGICRILV